MTKYIAKWTCRPAGAIGLHGTVRMEHTFETEEADTDRIRSACWDSAPAKWWLTHEHFCLVSIEKAEP
jgi:hypothetical protein